MVQTKWMNKLLLVWGNDNGSKYTIDNIINDKKQKMITDEWSSKLSNKLYR